MQYKAPPLSKLRVQRLARWAQLWLLWFAGFLDTAATHGWLTAPAEALAHRWLDRIERLIISLAVLRAAPRVCATRAGPRPQAHPRKSRGVVRAIVGARLRRALRPRTLGARIAALHVSIDTLAARMLARLPRGLTRRRPIRAVAAAAAAVQADDAVCMLAAAGLALAPPAGACDTS